MPIMGIDGPCEATVDSCDYLNPQISHGLIIAVQVDFLTYGWGPLLSLQPGDRCNQVGAKRVLHLGTGRLYEELTAIDKDKQTL